MLRLSGVLPPLPTPFRANGDLDTEALADLVTQLNGRRLSGYLALGSNGEASHLTPEEASRVFETVRKAAAPARLVLGGTGQPSTRATVEMTRRAADAGCGAALVLTPFYYRGSMTSEALRRHYTTVADASPIPVLLYNVPANTGFNLPPPVAAELSRHENVVGIKDSAGDIGQLAELVRSTGAVKPFTVLSGSFAAFLPGLTTGVSGAILAVANLFPNECTAILERFREGHLEEARELHLRLLPVARIVTTKHGVPGLKAAMDILGFPGGLPRAPLTPLPGDARAEVERTLREVLELVAP